MRHQAIAFDVSESVLALGLKGAYFTMGGLNCKESDPEFEEMEDSIEHAILSGLSEGKIFDDKILQGFRRLHEAVGVSNKKNVASSENLLTTLLRTGHLPNINLLVDIYNLVSVQTHLALGAHDLARVKGNIHLKLTSGKEGYWPLGSPEPKPVRPGCYSYIDDDDDVICWLEVRQVEKTKTTMDTRESFFIIQGNAATDEQYIAEATNQLISLVKRFCGGEERMLYASWL